MNLDNLLIKLFLNDSSLYHKYSKYLGVRVNKTYEKLYHALSELCEDEAPHHTVEDLTLKFHELYPVLSTSEHEILESTLDSVVQVDIQPEQAESLLRRLRERTSASELAKIAVKVASGDEAFSALQEAMVALSRDSGEVEKDTEDRFVNTNIEELHAERLEYPPYRFRLKTLNAILGGLHKRTFGFLFARPEAGKTQFLASEVSFLALQGATILWINNEEDGATIVPRLYQAGLGIPQDQLYRNVGDTQRLYAATFGDRIKIYDRPGASSREIERVIQDVKPDIIVIDQLDKVRGFHEDERYDLLQKAKYQWAREIAKKYNCAVIGVCQAGGSAENKRYLEMTDVDSSYTAKQGEADWMMGMGFVDKDGEEFKRYLSFCKNKLPWVEGMIVSMRHAKVPVISRPELQIYEDALNVE